MRRPSSGAFISPTSTRQPTLLQCRWSSANSRWSQGKGSDHYNRKAKEEGLRSRAAFKLIEVNMPFPYRETNNNFLLGSTADNSGSYTDRQEI